MNSARTWKLGALGVALLMVLASYLLLVAPKRSQVSSLNSETQAQDATNQGLQVTLEQLKAQEKNLPAKQAEMAAIRTHLPDNPALPSLIRSLTAITTRTGVDLQTIAKTNPVVLVEAGTPTVAAATTSAGTVSTSQAGGTTSASAAATAAAAANSQLQMMSVTLTVSGSYFDLEQFFHELESLQRSFLVTGFTLTGPGASAGASSSSSATGTSNVLAVISGRIFLAKGAALPATSAAVPATPAAK